jgi:hypothetical protein
MFLQNASYWVEGKSEFDFYNAEFTRDGERHQCELLLILTPEIVDPVSLAHLDNPRQPGALPTIRMTEATTVPRGLVLEQRFIEVVWRLDFMSLAKLFVSGTDMTDHVAKSISEQRAGTAVNWKYLSETGAGKIDMQPVTAPGGTVLFYDELPLRVRTLDFSKPAGDFEVQLAPTLATGQKELGPFKPAKISWKTNERTIEVDLKHAGGNDHFILDADFPFLLREWQTADGSRFKLKNSLRVDYRGYLKNGDRERALKDPMLRHPD